MFVYNMFKQCFYNISMSAWSIGHESIYGLCNDNINNNNDNNNATTNDHNLYLFVLVCACLCVTFWGHGSLHEIVTKQVQNRYKQVKKMYNQV